MRRYSLEVLCSWEGSGCWGCRRYFSMLGPRSVCYRGAEEGAARASSLGSVEERPLLVSKQLHPSHPGWRLGTASAVHCGGFRYTEEAASR
ncbi:hypothetical protein SRHO_G00111810 [Serrasalmus rhombeus]